MEQAIPLSTYGAQLSEDWRQELGDEISKDYFRLMMEYLHQEQCLGKIIYPEASQVFEAFRLTPFDQLKVVILGQDPYHGVGQAHGLSFSVLPGVTLPPSLRNIFIELKDDLGIDRTGNGCLNDWAEQGVLLLNTALTVEHGKAMSHQGIGWEKFTDAVIRKISTEKKGVVFILWGKFAARKETLIDKTKHYIFKSPHPSPLSAYQGFWGSNPFSKTNELLAKEGLCPIEW